MVVVSLCWLPMANIPVIITTEYLTKGDHWIRIKNVMEDDNGYYQFMHDYIEIVPMTVLRNEAGEDRL